MIKYLAGFLEETNGSPSSMRLNNFIIVCACCTMAIRVVWSEYEIDTNTTMLILGMLGLAFGAKAIQKVSEVKAEIEEKKNETP
jgi:hypothetical protein